MGPEFASVAKRPGEVIEKSDTHIAIKYKDGEIVRKPLGIITTTAEGSYYPNRLMTTLEVGDKVKVDDVITYNNGFFKPNYLDDRRVDYMVGCVGRIALREATYTVEDSSSISSTFASRMKTSTAKMKSIMVDFNQSVSGLVKPGDKVDLESILCTIEDAVSSDAGLYDDETREALRRWAAVTPRAKAVGTVFNVEIYYNGELENMSDSLRLAVNDSERRRKQQAKRLGTTYTPAQVNRQVRIDGHNIEDDQAIILIYIETEVAMGIGDKLVIANQMKSTVGEVLFGECKTEEGEAIDSIFGIRSCIDRIVTSPMKIGSTNTLLRYIGELAYEMYFESDE